LNAFLQIFIANARQSKLVEMDTSYFGKKDEGPLSSLENNIMHIHGVWHIG